MRLAIGFEGLNPGKEGAESTAATNVSPMLASWGVFIPAMM